MKTKKLKYAVITSVVAICLCLALFAGSTYAWFTDTLVSSGNVIEAGSVRVSADVYQPVEKNNGVTVTIDESNELEVYSIISRSKLTTTEGYTDSNDGSDDFFVYGDVVTFSFNLEGEKTDLAEDGAIYNAEKEAPLEPGVSAPIARIIEVENTGSLEAAVKLSFSAAGNLVSDMWADVLPVKYTPAEDGGSVSGGKDASILIDGTDAAGEAISFSPKSMSDINASNDSDMILKPGESGYLLLIVGIYADCSNEANGQNFDLEVAVLATQSVGHHNGDSGIQAEFPDWDGTSVDKSWYDPDDTDDTEPVYTIYTAAELAGLADIVNNEASEKLTYKWTVYLGADIDLENYPWTPIGDGTTPDGDNSTHRTFEGVFDGQGHTISNLNVSVEKAENGFEGCGLFGFVNGGIIRNVNIHNVKSEGERLVGTLIGTAYNNITGREEDSSDPHLQIENCHVTGLIEVSGHHQVGGLVGSASYSKYENCSVEGVSGSYVKSTYDVPGKSDWSEDEHESDYDGDAVGGLVGYLHTKSGTDFSGITDHSDENYMTNCVVSGLEISGCRKIGGLVGHNCGSIDLSGCVVEGCEIALVYNDNYAEAMNETNVIDKNGYTTKSAKLFVGALIGEFEWKQKISGDCTVENVTIRYLVEYGIKGNQIPDENGEYAFEFGLFGGSRNQSSVTGDSTTYYSVIEYETGNTVKTTNFTLIHIGENGLPV